MRIGWLLIAQVIANREGDVATPNQVSSPQSLSAKPANRTTTINKRGVE